MLATQIKVRIEKEKRTFAIQDQLISQLSVSPQFLIDSAADLQPSHYDDVVTERVLGHICGYPLCSNKLLQKKGGQKYHVSLSQKKVYDAAELNSFCCEECLLASNMYKSQLDETPVYLRNLAHAKKIVLHPRLTGQKTVDYITNKFPELKIVEHASDNNNVKIEDVKETEHFESEEEEEESDSFSSQDEDTFIPQPQAVGVPKLSSFGTIFTSLQNWCSSKTKEFLRNSASDAMEEYSISTETDETVSMRKEIVHSMIFAHLRTLCTKLKMIQCSNLEEDVAALLSTFNYLTPVESYADNEWFTFILVFLEVLTVRNKDLNQQLHENGKQRLRTALQHFGITEEHFSLYLQVFAI